MKSLKDDFDSSNKTPRTLYHVYQKLHQLRELIAGDDCPNAARLAEKMEISLRTVKRYLDHLRECGAPLGNNRKRGGYFFTDPFWQLPAMRLSEGDLLAFFIAEQSLKLLGHSQEAGQLRCSLSKLASFLPQEVSINLTALATGVSFEHLPFAAALPDTLALLTKAAINQQSVSFDYYSPHNREHTTRAVNVLLMHNFAGDWFAVCWDLLKKDYRDFHVGRMSNVLLLNEYFDPPKEWNSAEYLKTGFSMMRGGKLTEVEIVFNDFRAQWIREREFFHPDESREDLPDGSLRLRFTVGEQGLDAVARFCLTYAGDCEAIKPLKLRKIIKEKLAKAISHYKN